MGPDIINNKTGKPQMQLSIWCNNNFKQSWSCYHDADDMCKVQQFLIKVDKSIMKHLSPWCQGKGVPRWRIRKVTGTCKRWWDDPGFRVSHGLVAWKTSDNTDKVQTKGASHPTCIHAFTGVDSGLYLWNVHFWSVSSRRRGSSGSRRSRTSREVVVHETVVEVVVLSFIGDGSGSRRW